MMVRIESIFKEDKYVEKFLNTVLETNDIRISFNENNNSADIIIKRINNPYTYDLNKLPAFQSWDNLKIFAFNKPYLTKTELNITTNIDLIFSIFFFLSGYYEYLDKENKDNIGRVLGSNSFMYKNDILERPIVNEYVEYLVYLINSVGKFAKIRAPFRKPILFLSHDIDHLTAPFHKRIKMCLNHKKLSNLFYDPWNIGRLLSYEKKLNIKATYYFRNSESGYNINLHKKKLKFLGSEIKKLNGNIGYHYRYSALEDGIKESRIFELERLLDIKINSGRQHFLRIKIDKTFNLIKNTKIMVDSSGGFNDRIGFRFGTSWPFKPFCFSKKKEYDLYEIPLLIMDGTLAGPKTMNLTVDEGLSKIKKFEKLIEEHGGVLSVLWHNSSFDVDYWSKWQGSYERILDIIKKSKLNSYTDKEIIEFLYNNPSLSQRVIKTS